MLHTHPQSPARRPPGRRRSFRTLVVALCSGAVLLLAAAPLLAHDFWLVPDAFRVVLGAELRARGQTSSLFPTSEAAVAVDRVAEAVVLGANSRDVVTQLSHEGSSLVLRHRPRGAGQRVIAVRLKPRLVRESPASFRRYLELEGAPEALERYEREGRLPPAGSTDSLTRRYAKYAKTVVEVGRSGPRAFARPVGHPVEFLPLRDPAALRAGDTLSLRLVFRGRPLAGARLHAGSIPGDARASDTAAARAAGARDVHVTTDRMGVARIVVDRPGLWNVRTIQIVPADARTGADWDVHWATLVFGVDGATGGGPSTRRAADDSAEVAATVARYHEALARGDSATALALLAPHATILESGGTETVAQYRGHHLPSDIEFARAVPSVRSATRVTVRGDVAWAVSTSVTEGQFRGRAVNSAGAELMVLERAPGGWRIVAIHWSSRRRTP